MYQLKLWSRSKEVYNMKSPYVSGVFAVSRIKNVYLYIQKKSSEKIYKEK